MGPPRFVDRLQRAAVLATAALFSAGYAVVGLLLLLVAVIGEAVAARRLPWSRSAVDLWLIAFLSVFLVSGLLSPYRAIALGSAGLAALTIYLSLGVIQRVTRRDPTFLKPLMWTWVAGAVAASILALIVYRARGGGPALTPPLGQNALGTTLMIALMLGVGVITIAPRRWKLPAAMATTVVGAVLALTFTRGAWLGAVAGLIVLGALTQSRSLRTTGAFVILLALAAVSGSDTVRERIVDRATDFNDPGARGRIAIAQSALEMFSDHPVLGTGLNTFASAYPAYRRPGEPNPGESMPFAHNIWLNMAAEGGVVGVITFAGVLLAALRSGWRWYRSSTPSDESVIAASILAATLGAMVHQLFDGTMISIHLGAGLWMLMGVLTARAPDNPSHA